LKTAESVLFGSVTIGSVAVGECSADLDPVGLLLRSSWSGGGIVELLPDSGLAEHGLEDGERVRIAVVVVNDVDEVVRREDLAEELVGLGILRVEVGPLLAELESFILPCLKADPSTTVGCAISLPGNTPQVTAFGVSVWTFVLSSPERVTA